MQNKASIEKTIVANSFKVKKHFGQNFLSDSLIIERIVKESQVDKETTVIEIGPGTGALTEELLRYSKKVLAFEIDTEVIPILKENTKTFDNLEIINKDIMKADLSILDSIDGKVISVSNLPYYITSPIIDIFLKKMPNVSKGIFMMQKEVGDRISAKCGTKDYNSFSILVQYFADVRKLINVSRNCFTPAPNVDSVVVEIKKKERIRKPIDEEFFVKVVEGSFKERRKTLVNNLSNSLGISKLIIQNTLENMEIRPDARGEILSIDDFINLSDELLREKK